MGYFQQAWARGGRDRVGGSGNWEAIQLHNGADWGGRRAPARIGEVRVYYDSDPGERPLAKITAPGQGDAPNGF